MGVRRAMRHGVIWRAAIVAAIAMAGPATAQKMVSDSFSFLKAVRDRDGAKAQEMLDVPANNLVATRDEKGETALHIVTKRRDLSWVQFMLSHGAPVDSRDRQGMTALADAAQLGWSEGVQQLLDVGATVDLADDRGETPLILATQAHAATVVHILLDHGADPRATDSVSGMSAIDYATRDGRSQVLLKLLQEIKPVVRKKVSGPSING